MPLTQEAQHRRPIDQAGQVSGGEAVYRALRALGVDHVFGIVSVHNVPIFEAMDRLGGISLVRSRHEQAAVHAADGYARATGRLGVAIASTGPGTCNAVPGLYEAAYASSPVMLITGQNPSSVLGKSLGYVHEHERQADMLRSVVPYVESVRTRRDVASSILTVAGKILSGRPRPGAVEIPIDFQHALASEPTAVFTRPAPADPGREELAAALPLLNAAERPLIWAGGGATSPQASAALGHVARLLRAPVVNTINGRGCLAWDDPHRIGTVTDLPEAWDLLRRADAVLAVGTRFQPVATRDGTAPVPEAGLIHLDADPFVPGLTYQPAVRLICDAARGLTELAGALHPVRTDESFLPAAQAVRAAVDRRLREEAGPAYTQIVDAISAGIRPGTVIVGDTTAAMQIAGRRMIPVTAARGAIAATSSAIGPGVPTALGAAIGSGRPVLLLQGDGGLMLSLGELATVAEEQVPLVIVVFNDRGYGVLRMIESMEYGARDFAADLMTPDFVQLASSIGLPAARVDHPAQFGGVFEKAVATARPYLLDVNITAMPSAHPVAWSGRSKIPWD